MTGGVEKIEDGQFLGVSLQTGVWKFIAFTFPNDLVSWYLSHHVVLSLRSKLSLETPLTENGAEATLC